MPIILTESRSFQEINFSDGSTQRSDYENCKFENCSFVKANLTDISFMDCVFSSCDFSLAKIGNTAFREVKFKACKLVGLHFEETSKFGLSAEFDNCVLNLSSFYKLSLKNCKFSDSSLQEVDFTDADLSKLSLNKCNLAGCVFNNTNLERADFRTAYNFTINPMKNRIYKAKFSSINVTGLLDSFNILIE
ncbi:MAG: pentapeptide repeat-containing protein [Candidatus Kapabacteria bacterium]|nr:pentapeptide repeat-containing protein [Candidatus Kapabacteria bacterium]